jgi:hypothetical protein
LGHLTHSSDSYQEISKEIHKVRIIDSHEHLPSEQQRIRSEVDTLTTLFRVYASSDLVSSGMAAEDLLRVIDPAIPLEDRWSIFTPFWENVRHTGYARVLDIAIRDLYGVDGIHEDTYLQLSRKMKEANQPGLYRWILNERSGIDRCILDPIDELGRPVRMLDVDRSLFFPVIHFNDFVMVNNIFDLRSLSHRVRFKIHCLSDLVKALEIDFKQVATSAVGVKIALAYYRSIKFEKTTQSDAERSFNEIFTLQPLDWKPNLLPGTVLTYGPSMKEAKPLQDYMMHRVIQLASEYGLPVQIHTGLQEGFGNVISNSNPLDLTNLIEEYSDVRFDIFHGGYPYIGELATLAKNFSNVYIDMCWLHAISPYRARCALSEWIETVPVNKIIGFGGDYSFVEGTYGHSVLARQNIAKVLSEKVDEGVMGIEDAKIVGRRLLRDNALNLFGLSETAES